MKTTMKKWLSLLLTAVMLFGTFALAMPAMVLSASAEEYTNVPANTTVEVNGVKIRYDRYSGNDDGYVHVKEDGSIEFKIRHGDMVWFPDVVMTDSTTVHGEVTVISGTAAHSGFAYNVAKDGDSWASAMIVGYNNGARVRIAGDTKAKLGNNNGGDGYGSGGDSRRPVNGDIANSKKGLNGYYEKVQNANNEVATGKTVGVDLRKTDGTVYVDWLAVGYGPYHSANYADNTSTVPYLYAGGSVGYSLLYQGYNDSDKGATADHSEYIVRRLENLVLTNCKVNDVDTASCTLVKKAEPVMFAHNTANVINGISYRFDENGHGNSTATIHKNGSLTLYMGRGDLFWLPDVTLGADSKITAKVRVDNSSAVANNLSGVAYNVNAGSNNWWHESDDSISVAALYAGNGIRINPTTFALTNNNGTVNDQSYVDPSKKQIAFSNTTEYNGTWQVGQLIQTEIWKDGNTVHVKLSAENGNTITEQTYNDSSYNTFKGPVGYLQTWDDNKTYLTIESYTVTNAVINGVKTNFDLTAELAAYMSETIAKSYNLTLDGTIGMNFVIGANANLPTAKTTATISVGDTKIADFAWNATKGYYVATVPVAAKEINNSVTYTLAISVDGKQVESNNYTVSVASYAETLKEDATWGDLAAAILDYGNAADNYFNEAANTITGAAPTNLEDVAPITYADGSDLTILDEESRAVFMSLILEGTTTLKLYFKPNSEVCVTKLGGEEVLTATDSRNPGYQVISIENIAADDLSDEYAFEVTEVESGNSFAFTVSALSWVKAAYEKGSDATKDLAKTIANYAAAADAITGEGPAF